MFMAKNLKQLRLEKGLTQEDLAVRIGVTGQAVGKWERDECYPDITLLPGLAKIFGVTVDELIGIEEFNTQEKIREIQNRKYELAYQYKFDELVEFLEEENKKGSTDCLADLAIALALAGDKSERPMRLLEQALDDNSRSYKSRASVYAELCFMYQRYGLTDKAEKLARSLPHTRESRELLLPHFLKPSQREEYLRENLPGILTAICSLIDGDMMTNDEHIYSIQYGTYIKPIDLEAAIKKIAEFLHVTSN
jgi:Predicted transcriptional regulators